MSLNCTRRSRIHRAGRIAAGGMILLPLISVSILLLMYFKPVGKSGPDGEGKSYIEEVMEAKKESREVAYEIELLNLHKDIRMHAIMHNDKYPSLEKLLDYSSIAKKYFIGRGELEPLCVYIEGQNENSFWGNVLVYESGVVEGGSGMVLLKNGEVRMMSPEEITDAVGETEQDLTGR